MEEWIELGDVFEDLRKILEGKKFGLIGVGNAIRGDDGAGPAVAERLSGKVGFPVVDASEVPENYSSWILNGDFEAVVFVDAVDFGGAPGEVRLIPVSDLMISASSTHRLSLHFLIRYLLEQWNGEAVLVGIQPVSIELDAGLSGEVERGVTELVEFFVREFS